MKRLAIICLLLCVILCGCKAEQEITETTTETTTVKPTETTTTAPTEEVAPTETTAAEDKSYTIKLKAYIPIFEGPSHDEIYKTVVGEDGVYTIVETQNDSEGNEWGRLKSGIGWINLTELETYESHPVAISFANDKMLKNATETHIAEESDYTEMLIFTANETLTDVRFTSVDYTSENFDEEVIHSVPQLEKGETYALGVVFAGDMTTYGVIFNDENGTEHYYSASISGRNGALIWQEYDKQE